MRAELSQNERAQLQLAKQVSPLMFASNQAVLAVINSSLSENISRSNLLQFHNLKLKPSVSILV